MIHEYILQVRQLQAVKDEKDLPWYLIGFGINGIPLIFTV